MPDKTTVLVVDEHPSVRDGLRALISAAPDMAVVGEASEGEEAVEAARQWQPDVIVLDLMSAEQGSIDTIRAMRRASPDSQVIVLTDYEGADQVLDVVSEGVRGYLLKDPLSAEIASVIRNVVNGKVIIHRGVIQPFLDAIKAFPEPTTTVLPDFEAMP
jgi:DNA-binding NarL/FixJ family response regulator